jgi:NADPH:quinone reductase-like Zn-dependent oxidoreductase
MSAHIGLFELAHMKRGQTVLIHSAAGGVGSSMVQLCRIAGVRVVAVVGSCLKVETCRAFGADVVIDKSKQDLWQEAERAAPEGYDIVADANGVETLKQSYDHLRPTGRLLIYGFHTMMPKFGGRPNWIKLAWDFVRTPRFSPLDLVESNRSVLAFNLSYLFDRVDVLHGTMTELLGWFLEGKLVAPAVTTYPMAEAGRAHADIESGKTVGKLVLLAP